MVYIAKVYTRGGDGGQTMLASGAFVSKDSPRIEAYGTLDELGAHIGWIRMELSREPSRAQHMKVVEKLDAELELIQQELFNLGGELSLPEADATAQPFLLSTETIARLEAEIDAWNEGLAPLRSFVLAGGGPAAIACHVARTVCRRAERAIVTLAGTEAIRPFIVQYINRLSDALFVIGRALAHTLGYGETLWDPKRS